MQIGYLLKCLLFVCISPSQRQSRKDRNSLYRLSKIQRSSVRLYSQLFPTMFEGKSCKDKDKNTHNALMAN